MHFIFFFYFFLYGTRAAACQNGSEPLKKLADTIMEKLKTVRTDNSSSEEEPTEQDIQFAESVSVVSSQGRKQQW